ncbi:acyl-CoA/acyl-ACP dehydrogenase [Kibdelosporangium philippinense]|uniref:Acyl-CoA/acyl-ACP dehydrogenase n=1 Tax=Kibdelosporangium philippinense TaxID=211113 RepID=A0ABS8ZBI8_9PSEU|nr:acyl-CoA dehydrogenase family protein [Kibdelosporangium philippinense]MCE7004777.1 acyl-CoA/acyl-ACP dehydrogenase [Kibdelosporangium philippinense]
MTDLVERAQWIAENVFLPDAKEVDVRGVIPPSHFRVLAREGFYGIAAPDAGVGFEGIVTVIETLAGGCLPTTFTWLQHHAAVLGVAKTTNESLRARHYEDLVAGRKTSGVASAGALADPPRLRATKADGGWIFDGDAPFVSGWGIVDLMQVVANAGETVVSALIEAKDIPATRYNLIAVDASETVRLTFDNVFISDAVIMSETPAEQFREVQQLGYRLNGAVPTGLAVRCARILESLGRTASAEAIDAEVSSVRSTLDEGMADPQALFDARAAAASLAYRAAGAVFVAEGADSMLAGGQGERLVREALFTMVTGSRAPMKNALLDILAP